MAQFQTDETQVVSNELEKVRDTLEYLMDFDKPFYSQVDVAKNTEEVSARSMRVPLAVHPGGNFGKYSPEGGDMGRGGGPQFDKAVVDVVDMRIAIRYTAKADWATDSGRKAVVNTTRELVKQMTDEFSRQLDNGCMGDGTGVVATITSVSTAGGKDTYTCTTDGFGVRLIRFGQSLSVFNAALSASRVITPSADGVDTGESAGADAVEVDFIDIAAKQVRIKGAATSPIATDKLVVSGQPTATPTWIQGVQYHNSDASTGTWLGFNRANTPEIRANSVTASGPLSLSMARLAVNKIGERVGTQNRRKLKAWMHQAQKQAYEELGQLAILINKQAQEQGLNMYFDDMQLAGVPVYVHYSWDKTRIDFIDHSVWGRSIMKKVDFYTKNGNKLFEARSSTGTVVAAWDMFLVTSWQLFSNNPAVGSYIKSLTVPSGY